MSASRSTLWGMVPMLVTPLDAAGAPDLASMRAQVAHEIAAGADGLGILGLAGEGIYLSVEEREAVAAATIAAAGGTPVLVGTTADTTEDAVRLAVSASGGGAAMLMVAPPRRPDWSREQLRAHYHAIASAATCPIMIQDAPGFIGTELGIELVLDLARELANVRAFKIEALPYWENALRARATAGAALDLYGGHGGLYLFDVLDAEGHGLIPGADMTANLSRAWRAYRAGDRAAAEAEWRRVLPLIVFEAQSIGLFIGGAKAILHARGIIATTTVRAPGARLSPATLERVLGLARAAGIL